MKKGKILIDLYDYLDRVGEGVKIAINFEYNIGKAKELNCFSVKNGTLKLVSAEYHKVSSRVYLNNIGPGVAQHWLDTVSEEFNNDQFIDDAIICEIEKDDEDAAEIIAGLVRKGVEITLSAPEQIIGRPLGRNNILDQNRLKKGNSSLLTHEPKGIGVSRSP